jgi:RNA polymerase sigma factor (sigma-70 family)
VGQHASRVIEVDSCSTVGKMRPMNVEVETEVVALAHAGSFERAATRALEAYGAELYGFLIQLLGNTSDAGEVFAQASEDFWSGLSRFEFRCSVRTWLYVLVRHAAARYRRSPWNRSERRTGDSQVDSFVELARSRTQPWLRTEVKDRFHALRSALAPEDRTLLALRVDRDMAWQDIARVTLGPDEPEAAKLARETDRLRKRFQLLKEELRRRAREQGLLDEES